MPGKKSCECEWEEELRFLYASRTRSRGGFWLGIWLIAAIAAITTTGTAGEDCWGCCATTACMRFLPFVLASPRRVTS